MQRITKDGKVLTRTLWHRTLLRIPESDFSLWISAAAKLGVSRAAFMRKALRVEAMKTLAK